MDKKLLLFLLPLGFMWMGFYIGSLLPDMHWSIYPMVITFIFLTSASFVIAAIKVGIR